MIRNKFILAFISLTLLSAMTLADSKFFSAEQEDIVKELETEREEVREETEGEDWLRLHFSSHSGLLTATSLLDFQRPEASHFHHKPFIASSFITFQTRLFLTHCSLKIPIEPTRTMS